MRRIKIKREDKVRGFGILIKNNKYPIHCLSNNEYIIEEYLLRKLRKEKVRFKEIKV